MSTSLFKIQNILLINPTVKNIDVSQEIYLVTDASLQAIFGILIQRHDNVFHSIQFFSKLLLPTESKYYYS